MVENRRRLSAAFYFRDALEELEGSKTISQFLSEQEIQANWIEAWKRQLQEDGLRLFASRGEGRQRDQERQEADSYEKSGRLKTELEYLAKELPASVRERRRNLVNDSNSCRENLWRYCRE